MLPVSLPDAIGHHAAVIPDSPSLIDGGEIVDWATLQGRILAAAWHLRELGVGCGDVIALAMRRSIAQVIMALALVRLGAAWCVIDWRIPLPKQVGFLSMIGAKMVLHDRPMAIADTTKAALVDPAWNTLPAGQAAPPTHRDPKALALVSQSSGTTGLPKAVGISHEAMAWRGILRSREFGMRPGMRVLHAMPLWAAAPIQVVLAQLWVGATGIFHPVLSSVEELLERLIRDRVDHVALPPTLIRDLTARAKGPGLLLPDLQAIVSVGAAFHDLEKIEAMRRVSPNLWDDYGSAGTGPIAVATPDDLRMRPGSVGRVPSDVVVEIVDDDDQVVGPDVVGDIRVRSPAAAMGFVGGGSTTVAGEGFANGAVYISDLGRLGMDGYLSLEGRTGNVIIRGGESMSAEEIERVLLMHKELKEVAVVGHASSRLGEVPVALVVAAGQVTAEELIGLCRRHLQPTKVPVDFVFLDALPRTASGKIQRRDLAALLAPTQS